MKDRLFPSHCPDLYHHLTITFNVERYIIISLRRSMFLGKDIYLNFDFWPSCVNFEFKVLSWIQFRHKKWFRGGGWSNYGVIRNAVYSSSIVGQPRFLTKGWELWKTKRSRWESTRKFLDKNISWIAFGGPRLGSRAIKRHLLFFSWFLILWQKLCLVSPYRVIYTWYTIRMIKREILCGKRRSGDVAEHNSNENIRGV